MRSLRRASAGRLGSACTAEGALAITRAGLPDMEVRCPIHGLIEYNDLEERVINCAVMQRLRYIHQLAMAYLVYPGAVHTRFDHSLGVMHVAGKMADALGFGGKQRQNVRVAALLHDVGHGPFSHVSEIPLAALSEEYARRKRIETEKLHECITVDIIKHDRELEDVLGSRRDEIIPLIDTVSHPQRTAERDIISGPLDADKLDYLLRDSYFCGVKYGVYDLDRVINGLVRIPGIRGESYVGIKEESVWALEQHLMARYHMTLQVYRHRVRRCTDTLLARAILLAAHEGIGEIAELYTYKGPKRAFSSRWQAYRDDDLIHAIMAGGSKSRARKLVSALRSRAIPRSVLTLPLGGISTLYQGVLVNRGEQEELEQRMANTCSMDRDFVAVDVTRTDPPRPSSVEPTIHPEEILVASARGRSRWFHEVSDIFMGNPLRGHEQITVYLPLHGKTRGNRNAERRRLRRLVRDAINQREREGSQ